MCSMYWNLEATWTCPCGHVNEDDELQTHFLGDYGSCSNHYRLGEPVAELKGVSVVLGKDGPDDFIGICEECDDWSDLGGRVVDGVVTEVWVIAKEDAS